MTSANFHQFWCILNLATKSDRYYYITMKDINYIAKVLQRKNIQLHPKDEISIKLWLSDLKQKGAKTFCKDKLDQPPPRSRLARDLFILVIQTKFQSNTFRRL